MPHPSSRLNELLNLNAAKACTREELRELYELIAASGDEEILAAFDGQYSKVSGDARAEDIDWQYMYEHITAGARENRAPERIHRLPLFRKNWLKYAAAIALFALTAVWWYGRENKMDTASAVTTVKEYTKIDIPARGNKAVLTLADGTSIVLDSAADGSLAIQGNTNVVKLKSGELNYHSTGASASLLYNTIRTPNGGDYQVRLNDGTRIWLNAASVLKYPTAFSGDSRTVELSGEAYFEVSKDPARHFYVKMNRNPGTAGDMVVEALGTHFNINSYPNEPAINTTLIEGSVKISTSLANAMLKPGQQASVDNDASKIIVQTVNTESAIAWQKGYFYFDRADIKTVMRQLARWYDVTVEYEGELPSRRFMGEIQKDLKLSALLVNLEMIGIRSRLEGKKLIVSR